MNTTTKTYTITPVNKINKVSFSYIYDWITPKTVPLEKLTEPKECKIYNFGKYMETEEVLAEMKKDGYEPAPPNYLLGFVEQYPDELPNYLVAPSSVFTDEDGDRCFLDVDRNGSRRELFMVPVADEWAGLWSFLAVKSSDTLSLPESKDPLTLSAFISELKVLIEKYEV